LLRGIAKGREREKKLEEPQAGFNALMQAPFGGTGLERLKKLALRAGQAQTTGPEDEQQPFLRLP